MPQQKRYIKKKINRNVYFGFYLYIILALLSLFVLSSYTWFSLSRTPRVNNMNVYITSASGLELSETPGPENWVQEINFLELVPNVMGVTKQEIKNRLMLQPVTWSEQNGRFYMATYGIDGRHLGYQELVENRNENFIKAKFYARSGQTMDVRLQQVKSLNLGTDTSFSALTNLDLSGSFIMGIPGFSIEDILDGGAGQAEKAVRVGFQITMVDSAGNKLGETQPMIIYEPNYNVHINHPDGYIATPSIDGTATLVGSEKDARDRLLLQTATGIAGYENDEVLIGVGEFDKELNLFHLDPGDIALVEMYIWLEGQDVDCTNASAFAIDNVEELLDDQWLVGNIQFTGTPEGQSGMVTIPIE